MSQTRLKTRSRFVETFKLRFSIFTGNSFIGLKESNFLIQISVLFKETEARFRNDFGVQHLAISNYRFWLDSKNCLFSRVIYIQTLEKSALSTQTFIMYIYINTRITERHFNFYASQRNPVLNKKLFFLKTSFDFSDITLGSSPRKYNTSAILITSRLIRN